jgi:hypothetical protein
MKKTFLRLTLAGACLLAGGCASFVDGLNEVAWQLEQERLRQEHEAWLYAMYGPRMPSDTSAPGIK